MNKLTNELNYQKDLLNTSEKVLNDLSTNAVYDTLKEPLIELIDNKKYNYEKLSINKGNIEIVDFLDIYSVDHSLSVSIINDRKGYTDTNPIGTETAYYSSDDTYYKVDLTLYVPPHSSLHNSLESIHEQMISQSTEIKNIRETLNKLKEKEAKIKRIEELKRELSQLEKEI